MSKRNATKKIIFSQKDKGEYFIRFKDGGKLDIPLKKIGTTNKTGTKVRFMPDSKISLGEYVKPL